MIKFLTLLAPVVRFGLSIWFTIWMWNTHGWGIGLLTLLVVFGLEGVSFTQRKQKELIEKVISAMSKMGQDQRPAPNETHTTKHMFSYEPLTISDMSLLQSLGTGNLAALGALLNSRCVDKLVDFGKLNLDAYDPYMKALVEATNEGCVLRGEAPVLNFEAGGANFFNDKKNSDEDLDDVLNENLFDSDGKIH